MLGRVLNCRGSLLATLPAALEAMAGNREEGKVERTAEKSKSRFSRRSIPGLFTPPITWLCSFRRDCPSIVDYHHLPIIHHPIFPRYVRLSPRLTTIRGTKTTTTTSVRSVKECRPLLLHPLVPPPLLRPSSSPRPPN